MVRPIGPERDGPDDPTLPHEYLETDDPGIASAASAGGNYGGALHNMWAVTTATLRGTRCAMPGCGKERHDPIHALADD